VMVHDVPGTLSGNILRLQASIPPLSRHSAIHGDEISDIPMRDFDDVDGPEEDTSDIVAQLPLLALDERIHFVKRSRFRSEIPNLLQAKGLPHIVEILGRTDDGQVVFPKLASGFHLATKTTGLAAVKRILLELAEAVLSLHSIGIIHHDLALRNVLASSDYQTAYLCDLESCWGSEECPEIAGTFRLEISAVPYSEKSDVYMFGRLMTDFILANNPWTRWQGIPGGNWLPPAPFRSIVLACLEAEPSARPDMHQVKAMLEAVPVPG
ncbi:kinase-like domain-containing protein, partial [Mycena sp. CBHHK59/15]